MIKRDYEWISWLAAVRGSSHRRIQTSERIICMDQGRDMHSEDRLEAVQTPMKDKYDLKRNKSMHYKK